MNYIVTVHLCGGSQAEAANPRCVFGPFNDHTAAQEWANGFEHVVGARLGSYFTNELLVVVNPMADPIPDADYAAAVFAKVYDD